LSKLARYRVRRIAILPGAKFGCTGGILTALPVGLVCGWLTRLFISAVRYTLEGWQRVPLDMGALGQGSLNVVTLLRMNEWLARVRLLDQAPLLVIFAVTCGLILLLGSFGGLLGGVGALVYNSVAAFSGGLDIELEDKSL
jgi:hypothetical protein